MLRVIGTRPRSGSRPRRGFQPTSLQRNVVQMMAANGELHEHIAELLDINLPTLHKHLRAELRSGAIRSNPSMAMRLFERALAGDFDAMVFWLKRRAGWNENSAVTAARKSRVPGWLIRHFQNTPHRSPEHPAPSQKSAIAIYKPRGRGRPRFQPTSAQRMAVRDLAARGAGQEHIADKIGISRPTLHAQFAKELNIGRIQANVAIGCRLYQKAMAGNTAACIFWLKCRAGWNYVPHTGKTKSVLPAFMLRRKDVNA